MPRSYDSIADPWVRLGELRALLEEVSVKRWIFQVAHRTVRRGLCTGATRPYK